MSRFIDRPLRNEPENLGGGEEGDTPTRYRFTWVEMAVVAMILLILAALSMPGIQVATTSARRIKCISHLKQIGLAVQNYHDLNYGIPPLTLGDHRASFFVHLLPYAEAGNIYALYDGKNRFANTSLADPVTSDFAKTKSIWNSWTEEERRAASSLKWMICPARSSHNTEDRRITGPLPYVGPLGDYAVVFIDKDPITVRIPNADVSPMTGWQLHQDPCQPAHVERQKGAIRLPVVDCENKTNFIWKPRDTFARITDGLSQTFLVGEKHIRTGELGQYSSSLDDQDGVYTFTSSWGNRAYNVARNISLPLANGPNDRRFTRGQKPAKGPHADFGFGSWHNGGMVMFLRADGSVSSISPNIDEQIKRRLGHCRDGLGAISEDY